MSLHDITDDALIDEVRRRLDAGRFGFHGLMSTDQANSRDNFAALLDTVHQCCARYPREMSAFLIRQRAYELADRIGPQCRPMAINTTLYAVEKPEEHQEQWKRIAAEQGVA